MAIVPAGHGRHDTSVLKPIHTGLAQYHVNGDWRPVETRLELEAESLGALLGPLRGCVSSALLDEAGWRPVLAAAGQWPAACGALAFGFEFQLLDPRPRADFGLTLIPDGRAADWLGHQAKAATAPPFIGRLANLLDAMGVEGGPLNRAVDRIMLEVDIASASSSTPRDPGVFVYFRHGGPSAATVGRPDAECALAALNVAVGWAKDADEQRLTGRILRAVPPGARLISLGAFPGRGRGFRLTVVGFGQGAELAGFLRAVGWNGPYDALHRAIARLEQYRAFVRLGAMLYGRGDVLETRLGLYLRQPPAGLPALLEGLGGEGCLEEKLSGLRTTAAGPVALWGKSGEFTLLRELTHTKLVLSDTGIEQIKTYLGLVCA